MTTDTQDPAELAPGREKDAAVAEIVMGYRHVRLAREDGWTEIEREDYAGRTWVCYKRNERSTCEVLTKYTTTGDGLLLIVERMLEQPGEAWQSFILALCDELEIDASVIDAPILLLMSVIFTRLTANIVATAAIKALTKEGK